MPSRCPSCRSYDTYTIVRGRLWSLFLLSSTIGIISLTVVKDYINEGKTEETLVSAALAAGLFYAAYACLFKWRQVVSKCEDCRTYFNKRIHF